IISVKRCRCSHSRKSSSTLKVYLHTHTYTPLTIISLSLFPHHSNPFSQILVQHYCFQTSFPQLQTYRQPCLQNESVFLASQVSCTRSCQIFPTNILQY